MEIIQIVQGELIRDKYNVKKYYLNFFKNSSSPKKFIINTKLSTINET